MKNIRLISVLAVICIIFGALALVACPEERTPVDISGATDLSGLAGATIAAQSGTFHLDALNTLVRIKEKMK